MTPRSLSFLLLLGLAACGADDFHVHYAPGFSPRALSISVFAVKRDGQLSSSGWEALGPYAALPFGEECPVGYSDALLHDLPMVASGINEYARLNGVTDELFAQVSPAAKGDVVMLLVVGGHVSPGSGSGGGVGAGMPSARGGRGGGRRGGGGGGGGKRSRSSSEDGHLESGDDDALMLSAHLFSVREQRSVGVLELRYTGSRFEDAERELIERIRTELPNASCVGWKWSALSPAAVQRLAPTGS